MPRAIVAAGLILGGLMLGTWLMLVQGLFIGLTGREWLIKTSGFVGLVIFMVIGPIVRIDRGEQDGLGMAVGQLARSSRRSSSS